MAKQEIREFGDFTGENNQGYIIVGGKTADVEGGKKLLSDVIPVVPEQVNADWNAESGKAQIMNKPTIPSKTSELTNDAGFLKESDLGETLEVQENKVEVKYDDYSIIKNNDGNLTFSENYIDEELVGDGLYYNGSVDREGAINILNPIPKITDENSILTTIKSPGNYNYYLKWIDKPMTNGNVLTYDSSEGIVWAAPTFLTKAEADTYYAPKSEFDDLVAWLAPISANLVIAASNN